MRRRSIYFIALLSTTVLTIALSQPAQAYEVGCKDKSKRLLKKTNGKPADAGIYSMDNPRQGGKEPKPGFFDLSAGIKKGAPATIEGSAIMCGNDLFKASFYQSAVLTYPNKGEFMHCARPPLPGGGYPSVCDTDNNHTVIPNGAYVGTVRIDGYCYSCGLIEYLYDVKADVFVRSGANGTAGPGDPDFIGDPAKDHCVASDETIVACLEAYNQFYGRIFSCGADAIITKDGSGPYQIKFYEPSCMAVVSFGPIYLTTLRHYVVCKYANTNPTDPGSNSCQDKKNSKPNQNCSTVAKTPVPCALTSAGSGDYSFNITGNRIKVTKSRPGEKWSEIPLDSLSGDSPTKSWR